MHATSSAREPLASRDTHRPDVFSPLRWLRRGWRDMRNHLSASLAYGLIVVALGYAVLVLGRHPLILAGAVTGFLLVGPIFAAGLCELSRRNEAGDRIGFDASLDGVIRNRPGMLAFAGLLLGIGMTWFATSYLILDWLLGSASPALDLALWDAVAPQVDGAHVLAYLACGAVLAAVVLSISVVSVPLLVDRGVSARKAISESLAATCRHPLAVGTWGVAIVVLVGVGFATALLGLLVLYPWLGHASWHAYRDLLGDRTR